MNRRPDSHTLATPTFNMQSIEDSAQCRLSSSSLDQLVKMERMLRWERSRTETGGNAKKGKTFKYKVTRNQGMHYQNQCHTNYRSQHEQNEYNWNGIKIIKAPIQKKSLRDAKKGTRCSVTSWVTKE